MDNLTVLIAEIDQGEHDDMLGVIQDAVSKRRRKPEVTPIERLQNARNRIEEAKQELSGEAKSVLRDEVYRILTENEDIKNVAWGHKSSEYNDQGMYPGVAGPIINSVEDLNDYNSYEWLWSYKPEPTDERLKDLETILNALGEEILTDIFGDEQCVIAKVNAKGSVDFISDYVGY